MFTVGDEIKYSKEFIREAYTSRIDQQNALRWRGKIDYIYQDGLYEVVDESGDSFTMEETYLEIN